MGNHSSPLLLKIAGFTHHFHNDENGLTTWCISNNNWVEALWKVAEACGYNYHYRGIKAGDKSKDAKLQVDSGRRDSPYTILVICTVQKLHTNPEVI